MNPNYEIIEQLYRLDIDAGVVSQDQRVAQKELAELAKKTKTSEEIIAKTRSDMAFHEAELRRIYRKIDELEDKKAERVGRLSLSKNDEEYRPLKREIDDLEREIRNVLRKADEVEARIEQSKVIFQKAEKDLSLNLNASEDERKKAEAAENRSSGRLMEICKIRESYLARLEERLAQHYVRVARITRNPNGPVCLLVANNACGNCRIGLSPQILNNIIRGKTVETCPNCSHILLGSSSLPQE